MAGIRNNLFTLAGKVAIVTGASRGNGKAIADAFVEKGAVVYYAQRIVPPKTKTDHSSAHFVRADVTKKNDLLRLVAHVKKKHARIDVLVNNAGVSLGGTSSELYSERDWEETYATNLKAAFLLSQLVARIMIQQRSGSIINITSINAELGFPGNPAYVACKGGLKQLTKAFACDWGKFNIRVNNLGLGYFKTDMTRKSWDDPQKRKERAAHTLLGRWGEADDIAGPAIFLASDASQYITGQDLYVDGGWLAKGM